MVFSQIRWQLLVIVVLFFVVFITSCASCAGDGTVVTTPPTTPNTITSNPNPNSNLVGNGTPNLTGTMQSNKPVESWTNDDAEDELIPTQAILSHVVEVGAKRYLYVSKESTFQWAHGEPADGGRISIYSLTNNGTLTHVDDVNDADNANYQISNTHSMTSAEVGGIHYLVAAGYDDNGFSVFQIDPDTGGLTHTAWRADEDDNVYKLIRPLDVEVVELNDRTYLYVSGSVKDGDGFPRVEDYGINVFEINENGILTDVQNVPDDADTKLKGIKAMFSAEIVGVTYLFAAGRSDHAVTVFSVADDGRLSRVFDISRGYTTPDPSDPTDAVCIDGDDAHQRATKALSLPVSLRVVNAGGNDYLYVASDTPKYGIGVFSVRADGTLDCVDGSTTSTAPDGMFGTASSLHYISTDTESYLLSIASDSASSPKRSGFSAFTLGNDGTLTHKISKIDDATLSFPMSLTGITIGDRHFVFVTRERDTAQAQTGISGVALSVYEVVFAP